MRISLDLTDTLSLAGGLEHSASVIEVRVIVEPTLSAWFGGGYTWNSGYLTPSFRLTTYPSLGHSTVATSLAVEQQLPGWRLRSHLSRTELPALELIEGPFAEPLSPVFKTAYRASFPLLGLRAGFKATAIHSK